MPRRKLLTPAQREELLNFPTDEADLLRHYTFHTHSLAVTRLPPRTRATAFSLNSRS